MIRVFLLFILSFYLYANAFSQDTISYHISFPNAIHHEVEVSIEISNIEGNALKVIMSKSSPGRYAIHNFGKNIYNLSATEEESKTLSIDKVEPDVWEIGGFDNQVKINYTLFGNYANGTYSGIDLDYANLNMPATLIWIKGFEETPIRVTFHLNDTTNWKITTQLQLLDSSKHIYTAPNLQYLMDSPCMLSNHEIKEFSIGEQEEYLIKLAMFTEASENELNDLAKKVKRVIREQKEVYGEYPDFMDSTYSFLCSYGPQFHDDAMEHRNSTMISSPSSLEGDMDSFIGSISHEFFHVWNMERIRPKSLEPFDFSKANVSGELWFGEGFTNYYSDLSLCRAGFINSEKYIGNLSRLISFASTAPSVSSGSPIYMSEMASYTDRAAAYDETNFENTYFSYYSYGEIIALALDLSLRTLFNNIALDDLMKAMWIKYGKSENPYTTEDILTTLGEVCGDKKFAETFFNNHIYGNTFPDFENLFDQLGYKLIKKNPVKPKVDFLKLKFEGDTAILLSNPLVGSSFYEAGVNKGDLILSIDEQAVTSYPELNFIIGTRKIGDEIDVSYSHFGKLRKGKFKVKEDNRIVLVPKERFSIRENEEETKRFQNWLKSRIGD